MAVGMMAGLSALNRNLRRTTGQGAGTRAAKNVGGAEALGAGSDYGIFSEVFNSLTELPVSVSGSSKSSTETVEAPMAPSGFEMMDVGIEGNLEQELAKLRKQLGL